MTRPPVVLLGSQMTTGGAQRLLLDLAGWLHSQGWPVTAVFLYDKDGLRETWQARYPFPIVDLGARRAGAGRLSNALRFLGGLARLVRLLRRLKPGVLMGFTHHANLAGLPAAWLAGVPARVASHHGRIYNFPTALRKLHTWMVNSRFACCLTVISGSVRADVLDEGVRAGKIRVVLSGAAERASTPDAREHLRRELAVSEDDCLLLAVGRLNPEKGHLTLLRAFALLTETRPHVILTLAGDGPERAALQAEAQRLGVAGRVRFLGYRQDTPDLLAACDLFVQPSNWEGLGLAVIEAMLAGTPALVTKVGGQVELAADGAHLALVPPADPPAMAAGLAALLDDPARARQMAAAARQFARQNLTLERMCAGYAAVFEECLSRRPGASRSDEQS